MILQIKLLVSEATANTGVPTYTWILGGTKKVCCVEVSATRRLL